MVTNFKGTNKNGKIYVGRSMIVHIFCFALIHYARTTHSIKKMPEFVLFLELNYLLVSY